MGAHIPAPQNFPFSGVAGNEGEIPGVDEVQVVVSGTSEDGGEQEKTSS